MSIKLPIVPHDKANHFIYGFVIFTFNNLFFSNLISIMITLIIAISKEIKDEYDSGGFNIIDILWTISPSIILTLISTNN